MKTTSTAHFGHRAAQLLIVGCSILVGVSVSARPRRSAQASTRYIQLNKSALGRYTFSTPNAAYKTSVTKRFRVKNQSAIIRYEQRGKTGFKAQPVAYQNSGFGHGYFVVNVAEKGIGLTQVGLQAGSKKAAFSRGLLKTPRGVKVTKVNLGSNAKGWIGVAWEGLKNGKEVSGYGKLSGKLPNGAEGMKLTRTRKVAPTYGGGWLEFK